MSSFGQDYDSVLVTNPAEPYMDVLEKYLPGVSFEARPCWCIYSFDPAQLATLLQHVEAANRPFSPDSNSDCKPDMV